jgi:hypothetical protein
MNIRKLLLGSAAALVIAAPAIAFATEMGPNGPQVSTPAEKAQTQSLNNAQQNGSYVDPNVANGQATQANPVPAELTSGAASNTANADAQYQAQQQDYRNKSADYDAQMNAYEHQRAAYEWQRRHPETWWHDRYSHASYNDFYVLDRPALIDVAVTDRDGYMVGHVSDVDRDSMGHIQRVQITLGNGRLAWIPGRDMRYYRADRTLMIDLTPRQIWERSSIS